MSHAEEFDEYGHKDHGHVIVSLFTLRFVLVALLICTLLTSGAAYAEGLIASTFHVEIPQWINAAVALSIAVVKTVLVVMFFMQLKYDNPMNTIIFVFTVLTVFSFLGFTGLDLGKRDTIDRFKAQYAYDGGNLAAKGRIFENAPEGESIVQRARRIAKEKGTYDPHHEHPKHRGQIITDMGFLREEPVSGSSSNLSRPVEGITIPGLPGYRPPASHGHGGHGDHKPASETHPAEDKQSGTSTPQKSKAEGEHGSDTSDKAKPHSP